MSENKGTQIYKLNVSASLSTSYSYFLSLPVTMALLEFFLVPQEREWDNALSVTLARRLSNILHTAEQKVKDRLVQPILLSP